MLEISQNESPLRGTELLNLISRKRNLGGDRTWRFRKGDVFLCGARKIFNPWVVTKEAAPIRCNHTLFLWIKDIRDLTIKESIFHIPRKTKVVSCVRIYRFDRQPMASVIKSAWMSPDTLRRYMRPVKGVVIRKLANHPDGKYGDAALQSLYIRLGVMPGKPKVIYHHIPDGQGMQSE